MINTMRTFDNFTDAFYGITSDVYNDPEYVSSPRGMKVREKLGYKFCIENPQNRLLHIPEREFSVSYWIAEMLWYTSANDSTSWISNYSSFWNNISDDGLTANSAYGARIFAPHSRVASDTDPTWTQWNYVIDELTKDKDSRRAVIHIRSPKDSILANKDVPCTLTLHFFLREDKLHLVANMRSSDVVLGLTYDVPAFTFFQEMLAKRLSQRLDKPIGLGRYSHVSNSIHIYERHFSMVEKIIERSTDEMISPVEMPMMPLTMPIKEMVSLEASFRRAKTKQELADAVCNIIPADMHQYWSDWCFILASHRAGKLGDKHLQRSLLTQTSFVGYRLFSK